MPRLKFARAVPVLCAVFMLAACGGGGDSDSDSTTAVHANPSPTGRLATGSGTVSVDASPRAMAGFANVDKTCYANSALKLAIHSIGPKILKKHLEKFAQDSASPQREAAQSFVALIEKTYSDVGPTFKELEDFFGILQRLPAFSSMNVAEELTFPIVGRQQDLSEFLAKLSESFALHTSKGLHLALEDDNNQFKSQEEYWTILQAVSADKSLQDIFDRTQGAGWQYEENRDATQRLTVKMDNTQGPQGQQMISNRHFDFNQTVSLQFTKGDTTTTLTLEPREVVEFRGTDNHGHYVVYAKDEQWVRYDDDQVTVLSQMPAIENAYFINFAIRRVATFSSTSTAS